MSGWVRIERDLWDHDLFANDAMSEREAWCWMIATAAWEDTRHRVGGEMHEVSRGSFMVTLRELQSRFRWGSDTRVRNFLKRLEAERMIERTTVGTRNAPKTHVTICNYDQYQSPERTENAPKTHHERTENAVKEQYNNKQSSEPKGSSEKAASDRDRGFDQFWEIWPDKRNKEAARKAWRKLSLENRRAAYAGVANGWFERWRCSNPDANAIHASTFLNKKRWEDTIQPQLRPIEGGRNNGKRSITARLFAGQPGMDLGEGRDASEPLFPADGERGSGTGRDGRLDQGPVGFLAGPDRRSM